MYCVIWKTAVVLLVSCMDDTLGQLPEDWKSYVTPEILGYLGRNESSFAQNTEYYEADIKGIDLEAMVIRSDTKKTQANFINDDAFSWPNRIIPYVISNSFRDTEKVTIRKALRMMSSLTSQCITFIDLDRTDQKEHIKFVRGIECWSFVGRQPDSQSQIIQLSAACMREYGDIQHEVMHALGFFHEMTRSDRDQYVRINYQNVEADALDNFEIKKGNTFGLPYDYASVMHYPFNAFAKDTNIPTIVPRKGPAQCIAQRINLSPLDAVKIRIAYKCMSKAEVENTDWEKYMVDHPVCAQVVLKRKNEEMQIDTGTDSPSGTFRLTFQPDNNVVLSRVCDNAVVFATDTWGSTAVKVTLEVTGNLTVRARESGELLWSTWTDGYPKPKMFLSDSGYFYLCNTKSGCFWRSMGYITSPTHCNGFSDNTPAAAIKYKVIATAGTHMVDGKIYKSPNKQYHARFASLRMLFVRRRCDKRVGFSISGNGTRVTMEKDGKLGMYDANDEEVWTSRASGDQFSNAQLRLYDDGFLYLCTNDGCYWQSSGFLDSC